MNCQIPVFVAATLALQTTALSADADSRPLRVLLNDRSSTNQPVKVTAQVGERVVVCGRQGQSVVEVIVRKLPPEKRAIVYVDVRPTQGDAEVVLPMALPIGRWFRLINVNSGH